MELRPTTSMRLPLRNSSAPRKYRAKARAADGVLTSRSRRVSRLDNALEDARVNSGYPAFVTSRLSQHQTSDIDHLQNVYDRVEQRNGISTRSPPRMSVKETHSAELAVQYFVDKMRRVADTLEDQTKSNMVLALISELEGVQIEPQQNQVDALPQSDDISCWYTVGKEIGRGTFGRVRSGTHRLSGTVVAIKSYARLEGSRSCLAVDAVGKRVTRTGDTGSNALEWRRVRQEAHVLSKLPPHQNIMRFVEVFETSTRIHAVTEFVRGMSLLDVLQRAPSQRLKESRAKQIFRQLTGAVQALHEQCVIHRDLKLENILVEERSGHVTIIDFGFSDLEGLNDPAEDNEVRKQIKKKNFCGTPSYMAPEVVVSESYDGRPVDVWSLGVLLYVMLCGKFPFQGTSFHHLYQKLRSGAQQLALPSTLSTGARSVLQAALTVDPLKRPSAEDLCNHPWLKEPEHSHTSLLLQQMSAFAAWTGTQRAVYDALVQIYRMQINSPDQRRERRRSHLDGFVRLAKLESWSHFHKIVDIATTTKQQPDNDNIFENSSVQETQEGEISSVTSSLRHKQQLEKLIGLVKTSLATSEIQR